MSRLLSAELQSNAYTDDSVRPFEKLQTPNAYDLGTRVKMQSMRPSDAPGVVQPLKLNGSVLDVDYSTHVMRRQRGHNDAWNRAYSQYVPLPLDPAPAPRVRRRQLSLQSNATLQRSCTIEAQPQE